MVESNNAINNTVGASISGVTNTLTVTNPSDTASSVARTTITVGGASAGDPSLNFNVSGITNFEMGIDNNASDSFKISASSALGTTDTFVMTTAGERTMPLQPAFLATGGVVANVTGDGSAYSMGASAAMTEILDQGSDFTPGDGVGTAATFTSPISASYYLAANISTDGASAAQTQGLLRIDTSNRNYTWAEWNPAACVNLGGGMGFSGSFLADMDAADTATIAIVYAGGALDADIRSAVFSGFLAV